MAKPARNAKNRKKQAQLAQREAWMRAGVWSGVALAVLTLVGLAYRHVSNPEHFPLRHISVANQLQHLQPKVLEQVVAGAVDGNYFTVDMQVLRDQVKQLAWVDELMIRRVWPWTLSMQVVEQEPVARWGGDAYLNLRGEVFRPESGPEFKQLVELFGPDHKAREVMAMYRPAVELLQPLGLVITRFGLDSRHEWVIEFANSDLRLALGREQTVARLQRFVSVYPALAAEPGRRPLAVDLRYAQGFAVSWKKTPDPVADAEGVAQSAGQKIEHEIGIHPVAGRDWQCRPQQYTVRAMCRMGREGNA